MQVHWAEKTFINIYNIYVYKEDDIEDLYNEPDPRDDIGHKDHFER